MAELLARFRMIDEMSSRLEQMSQRGQKIITAFERIGTSGSAAFDGVNKKMASVSQAADKVSRGLSSVSGAAGKTSASVHALSKSVSDAADTQDALSGAMEKAGKAADKLADSGNVSAEAQGTLAEASENAEKAMRELDAAQREAVAALENYNAVLDSGADNMDELSEAEERNQRAAERLAEADAKASKAAEKLSDATEEAANAAEKSGQKSEKAITQLSGALAAAGVVQMVHKIADAFIEASEAAAAFETGVAKVSTIADTSRISMGEITSQISALSRETGQSVTGLSEAVYSAISASVDTASAVQFTGTATKLAAGGFTAASTAVDVLTTALNAYGLSADKASNISDMLITTQNLGKTSVDELAASVGKVIPLAAAYGVEMDNLSAAYAELTKGGIATAEAGTYLKSMLSELGDSGSTVSAVLKAQTGATFAQLTEQGYSLGDVMEVLGKSVNGNAGAFNELWSSSEAGIGALSLYNAGATQFNTTLNAMQTSAGATQAAYDAMTNTVEHSKEALSVATENLKISFGQTINPYLKTFYDLQTNVLNGVSKFVTEHPVVAKAITALTVGFGAAILAVGGIAAASLTAIPAVAALGAAISAAIWPATAIAAAVTAVVGVVMLLSDAFSKAEDETAGMTAATREQYYELQNLQSEYEKACSKYGETSEQALRLKYQVDDLTAAFEGSRQTVEQFTAEADALCKSTDDIAKSLHDGVSDIQRTETGTLALIQKYRDLSSVAERTKTQQYELDAVTQSLAKSYPKLTEGMKEMSGSSKDYADALKRVCEEEANERRLLQSRETYTAALEKQAELEEQIAKAKANLELEQKRMDDMSGWSHFWTRGEWDDLKAYQTALDNLNAAQAENNATIAEVERLWNSLTEAELAATDGTLSYEQAVSKAYGGVKDEVEKLCAAYDEAYKAAKESFAGQFGLFDEASVKSDEYLNATVKNAQKALDSQLKYWDAYLSDVDVLKKTSADDLHITQENYQALMAYVQDGSEEAAGLAHSMVKQINAGNEEAVAKLANTLAEVQTKREKAAASVAELQTDLDAKLTDIEKRMGDAVEKMNLSKEAEASAKSTIDSYIQRIKDSEGEAVKAAASVANSVAAALAAKPVSVAVKVNQVPGTTLPANANGTTNAESAFIAGEKGRELIVRKADAYAVGTTDSSNYYIAGENGPELIIGQQGSKVFPHGETEKIIRELNRTERTDYRNTERDFRTSETVRPLVILSPSEKIREAGRERESAFHTDRTERITEKALEVRESVANETSVLNQLVSRVERVAALEPPKIPSASSETRIATAFPSEPESVTRLMKSDASAITRTIVTLIPVMVYQAAERLAAQIAAADSGESLSLITNGGTLSAPESVTLAERAEQSAAPFRVDRPFRIADADERKEPVTEPDERRTTPEDNGTREARSGGEQTRRILLEINGSGAIDIGRNSPEEVLAIMQTHLKPCMMSILKTEIYEEGDASYDF